MDTISEQKSGRRKARFIFSEENCKNFYDQAILFAKRKTIMEVAKEFDLTPIGFKSRLFDVCVFLKKEIPSFYKNKYSNKKGAFAGVKGTGKGGNILRVNIAQEVFEKLQWEKGDNLQLHIKGRKLILEKSEV